MDGGGPPEEVRNAVYRLASYVAKNGPSFEEMTREKQRNNPKFSFLFHGGAWSDYYRQTLAEEIARLPPQMQFQPKGPAPWQTVQQGGPGGMAPPARPPPGGALLPPPHGMGMGGHGVPTPGAGPAVGPPPPHWGHPPMPPARGPLPMPPASQTIGSGKTEDFMKERFRVLLAGCTAPSIQGTREWIETHCSEPKDWEELLTVLQAELFRMGSTAQEHLTILYLYSDLLYHCKHQLRAGILRILWAFALVLCHRAFHSALHEAEATPSSSLPDSANSIMQLVQQWGADGVIDAMLLQELVAHVPAALVPPKFAPKPSMTHAAVVQPTPPAPGLTQPPRLPGEAPRYYELPAGLIVPLVSLEDRDYHPVDPSRIKPLGDIEPTRRILEALDEFFRPERPRDGEGWEEDGLSGFFDKKRRARRRRSRSRSPPPSRRRRSRSPERKRSLSPPRWSLGSDSSREKKRKATDKVAFVAKSADSPLDRGNLGFKMLKGMGWEGEGLGKAGAGIQEPVKAAESRDRSERFVGLGNGPAKGDAFESFRKQRSAAVHDYWTERNQGSERRMKDVWKDRATEEPK